MLVVSTRCSFAFGQAAVPNLASGLPTVTQSPAGPLRRFDFAGGAEQEPVAGLELGEPQLRNLEFRSQSSPPKKKTCVGIHPLGHYNDLTLGMGAGCSLTLNLKP